MRSLLPIHRHLVLHFAHFCRSLCHFFYFRIFFPHSLLIYSFLTSSLLPKDKAGIVPLQVAFVSLFSSLFPLCLCVCKSNNYNYNNNLYGKWNITATCSTEMEYSFLLFAAQTLWQVLYCRLFGHEYESWNIAKPRTFSIEAQAKQRSLHREALHINGAATAHCFFFTLLYITTNCIAVKGCSAAATTMPRFEISSYCYCKRFSYFLLHNIYITLQLVAKGLLTRLRWNIYLLTSTVKPSCKETGVKMASFYQKKNLINIFIALS